MYVITKMTIRLLKFKNGFLVIIGVVGIMLNNELKPLPKVRKWVFELGEVESIYIGFVAKNIGLHKASVLRDVL